jgi:hypothetical protein
MFFVALLLFFSGLLWEITAWRATESTKRAPHLHAKMRFVAGVVALLLGLVLALNGQ